MTIQVDRQVYGGIEAVRESQLVDLHDIKAVAYLCSQLGFHVAELFVKHNPSTYLNGVQDGFSPIGGWDVEDAEHIAHHTSMRLAELDLNTKRIQEITRAA